ncbi:hypothetical protein Q5P01_016103 [Channa striata]|uniref:Reelin domain-containing protein n=1 Tax=Channa striata TaxID=64152 RepID=A0AA88MCV7_CHASR|nr:hypothetical protein Q5P01_016103 [Channa striata]
MWLWILIFLDIVTKVHGFASNSIAESCQSMSPVHFNRATGENFKPQNTESSFQVICNHGQKAEPVTVSLISTGPNRFKGFMLEARTRGVDESQPVGKFIILQPDRSKVLTCGGSADSAVMQQTNAGKSSVKVNWTAEGQELDIVFRATFVESFGKFWESVYGNCNTSGDTSTTTSTLNPSTLNPSTTKPSTTELSTAKTSTTKPSTTELSTAKTSTTKPSTTDLSTAKTSTTKPSTTELSTAKTSTTKPSTTDLSTAKTSTTKPSSTELSTAKTSTTKSNTAEPSTEELSTNDASRTTSSPTTSVTSSTLPNITQSCERNYYHQVGTALICFDGFLWC